METTIFGPPGTGKTTRLISIVQKEIEDGTVERDNERQKNYQLYGVELTDEQVERGDLELYDIEIEEEGEFFNDDDMVLELEIEDEIEGEDLEYEDEVILFEEQIEIDVKELEEEFKFEEVEIIVIEDLEELDLVDIKIGLENMLSSTQRGDLGTKAKNFSDILKNIPQIPDQAKARNPNLRHVWDQDPLFVMSQYGKDAVSFNKLVWSQEALLKAMSDIPKANNTKFEKGLKKFLIEEYTVFTEGTKSRPDWVNNMVYYVNAMQTARTMGLNVTGAIKNAASAIHYFSHIGPSAIKRANKLMGKNGRVLVRKSGTEPKIRIMAESYDKSLILKCIKIIKKSIK